MNERISITDTSIYLNQYKFNTEAWLKREASSDQLFCHFVKFFTVLALSNYESRRELKIGRVDLPQTDSSISLLTELINQIKTVKYVNRRPDQDLLINSHLFIPYIFPYVLTILNEVDMLTDAGLKSVAVFAIENIHAVIDDSIKQHIIKNTPIGKFKDIEEAKTFLKQLVDTFRESYGNTSATSKKYDVDEIKNLNCTMDVLIQRNVLNGLIDYFRPKKIISRKKVNSLCKFGYIKEEPEEYLKRMKVWKKHKEIIHKGLTKKILIINN